MEAFTDRCGKKATSTTMVLLDGTVVFSHGYEQTQRRSNCEQVIDLRDTIVGKGGGEGGGGGGNGGETRVVEGRDRKDIKGGVSRV